ncbi:CLUMA_CG012031, isoform A [Clunio marinus]|uniref:CLUMA_CG012031, isoform A n=1 Tax=Clunio marinus TaxID=568069 RepID=A0A1J1IK08_9DIPT|nr:CLUMA_CG012031, isoform A [Clunio marinus]
MPKNKNKKNKPSGFWCFAMDYKNKMSKRGKIINVSELSQLAGPEGNKLSESQQKLYNMKAKTETFAPTPKKQERVLYNSLGQNIKEVEDAKISEKRTYEVMTKDIQEMLQNAEDLGELEDLVFYFVSTSSFFNGKDGIYPAELAVAKFSLMKGVFDTLHIRVNPGDLPLGSKFDAQEKAKEHKYPLPPNTKGEKDYVTILEQIMDFFMPLEKLPILFADGNTTTNKTPLMETCKVFEKIFHESQEADTFKYLKIYPNEELLFALQNLITKINNKSNGTSDVAFGSRAYAAQMLKSDEFCYSTKGCDFHNEHDVAINCCLSKVRQNSYKFAKWCCDKTRIPLQIGNHMPEEYEC